MCTSLSFGGYVASLFFPIPIFAPLIIGALAACLRDVAVLAEVPAKPEPAQRPVNTVTEVIDAGLVRGIFEHLRGDFIFLSVRSRDGTVFFRGPGWVFVVASLANSAPIRRVSAVRLRDAEPSA